MGIKKRWIKEIIIGFKYILVFIGIKWKLRKIMIEKQFKSGIG